MASNPHGAAARAPGERKRKHMRGSMGGSGPEEREESRIGAAVVFSGIQGVVVHCVTFMYRAQSLDGRGRAHSKVNPSYRPYSTKQMAFHLRSNGCERTGRECPQQAGHQPELSLQDRDGI